MQSTFKVIWKMFTMKQFHSSMLMKETLNLGNYFSYLYLDDQECCHYYKELKTNLGLLSVLCGNDSILGHLSRDS